MSKNHTIPPSTETPVATLQLDIRKLHDLAVACYYGAVNPVAIVNGLCIATKEMTQDQIRDSLDVKMIVGQLSYLLKESLGPREETIFAFRAAYPTVERPKIATLQRQHHNHTT